MFEAITQLRPVFQSVQQSRMPAYIGIPFALFAVCASLPAIPQYNFNNQGRSLDECEHRQFVSRYL